MVTRFCFSEWVLLLKLFRRLAERVEEHFSMMRPGPLYSHTSQPSTLSRPNQLSRRLYSALGRGLAGI